MEGTGGLFRAQGCGVAEIFFSTCGWGFSPLSWMYRPLAGPLSFLALSVRFRLTASHFLLHVQKKVTKEKPLSEGPAGLRHCS